jgi:hypothetical protein
MVGPIIYPDKWQEVGLPINARVYLGEVLCRKGDLFVCSKFYIYFILVHCI